MYKNDNDIIVDEFVIYDEKSDIEYQVNYDEDYRYKNSLKEYENVYV